jgi:hypothetical protein
MFPFEDRFTRQRQLPEVGMSGQQRLALARLRVRNDAAGAVEATYLQRAGTSVQHDSTSAVPEFLHAGEFADPAARQFAEGAWRAVRQVRQVLGITTESREIGNGAMKP